MALDLSAAGLPFSGRALLGIAAYVVASIGAGQMVAHRTIEKMGWLRDCEAGLRAASAPRAAPMPNRPAARPPTDCQSMVGWLHPDASRLCGHFGNPDLASPMARAEREAERQREALAEENRRRIAQGAASRCGCAAALYARENVLALAAYAGTARLIALPEVVSLRAELGQALVAPVCVRFTEAQP